MDFPRFMRFTATAIKHGFLAVTFCAASLSAQLASFDGTGNSHTDAEQSTVNRSALSWSPYRDFDKGYYSSIAMHPSGLMVEVHQDGFSIHTNDGLWYHVGKLDPSSGQVTWGPSRHFLEGDLFAFPSVAITKEGYVIFTFERAYERLGYSVGTLDLNGGTEQQVNFKMVNEFYDTGLNGSVAVNANGVIVEAHEGDGSDNLFFRLGRLRSPGTGDFSIDWTTGNGGVKYDGGKNPHISVNDRGEVIEVHQVTDESICHYIRGHLSGNTINFAREHPRLDDRGFHPNAVILNNGSVVTFNIHVDKDFLGKALYTSRFRLWELDTSDASRLTALSSEDRDRATTHPAGLATNQLFVIATPGTQAGRLAYTWTPAPQ